MKDKGDGMSERYMVMETGALFGYMCAEKGMNQKAMLIKLHEVYMVGVEARKAQIKSRKPAGEDRP